MKLARRAVSPPFSARPPAGAVIYAIGDIHGCADLCRGLHQAIAQDAEKRASTRKVVVYLGDYSGRGPDTRGVIDALMARPLRGFEAIFLKGNNEDLLLRMLDGDAEAGGHWLTYGGRDTLASYGIPAPQASCMLGQEFEEFRRNVGRLLPVAHLEFLRSLPVCHREGDYFFVHAGIRPGARLEDQTSRDMMWIRKRFLESDDDFGVVVVHGHSVSDEPVVRRNRIGIDTGSHATGLLTAVVLEDDACAFLQASAG